MSACFCEFKSLNSTIDAYLSLDFAAAKNNPKNKMIAVAVREKMFRVNIQYSTLPAEGSASPET